MVESASEVGGRLVPGSTKTYAERTVRLPGPGAGWAAGAGPEPQARVVELPARQAADRA